MSKIYCCLENRCFTQCTKWEVSNMSLAFIMLPLGLSILNVDTVQRIVKIRQNFRESRWNLPSHLQSNIQISERCIGNSHWNDLLLLIMATDTKIVIVDACVWLYTTVLYSINNDVHETAGWSFFINCPSNNSSKMATSIRKFQVRTEN